MNQTWLETKYEAAMEDRANGKTIISVGAGDTNNAKQVTISVAQRCRELYHDLSVIDPATYPPQQGIDRTKAAF